MWFEVGRTDLLRGTGWNYREMEAGGFSLPVIEAHCTYRAAGAYDDDLEVRTTGTLVSPVRVEFSYEVVRAARQPRRSPPAAPCTRRSIGAAGRAGCRTRVRIVLFMKALVTGVAGFIGSTLAERLLADGADVVGLDCFTDYYPRPVKERNLAGLAGASALPLRRVARSRTPICAALLADRTHVFHLAAQAGVRKSWGADFAIYTVNNIEATQVLLEAACRMPTLERLVYASSSSVYGDNVAMPMREDALPQPVSPYGVTKLAAEQLCYLYHRELRRADGVAALFHRLRPASAARHGLPQVPARDARGRRRSPCTATASRHATSRSSPMR